VPILGTTVESLDAAGDREQFRTLLQQLGSSSRRTASPAASPRRGDRRASAIPCSSAPASCSAAGRWKSSAMKRSSIITWPTPSRHRTIADAPILVDKFLDAATEVDVDCIADFDPDPAGRSDATGQAIIIGVMEHIEEAGIHSGDSACSLPPYSLSKEIVAELKDQTRELAKALRVRGLMNVQYAIKDGEIYVIEVNPRASRTVPFVSKATGQPWAKIAAKVMAGKSLAELGQVELHAARSMSA
jgi:carbamoyl-phosphate synthase large subunit